MPPWLVRLLPFIGAFLTGALAAAQQSLAQPGPINWYLVAAWMLVGGVLSAFGIHLPAPQQQQLVNDLLALVERLANREPTPAPPPAPVPVKVEVVTPPAVIPPAPATVPLSGKPAAAPLQSVTQGAPPAVSIPTVQTPTTVTVGPPVVVTNAPAEPPNG